MNNKIWKDVLDKKYPTYVERLEPYKGELVIMDGDKEIYRRPINISYDAKFGPDVMDISEWENMVAKFIDEEYNK